MARHRIVRFENRPARFRHPSFRLVASLFLVPLLLPSIRPAAAEEVVGQRPYEMVRAGRTEDARPPLIDFQSVDDWTVETTESEASFVRTREQQLFGDHVARLTYKAAPTEEPKTPVVVLKLPEPIEPPKPLDCINWWVYGNNWAWESDDSTPRTELNLMFRGDQDREVRIHMETVRWKEWFLIHRKLTPEQLRQLGDSPRLEAIELRGGSNRKERSLYFSNLSFYREELKPLSFEPRPKRGIELPEGQTTGTNTGPGKLPFPNREETILPTSEWSDRAGAWQKQDDDSYSLSYSLHGGGKGEGVPIWKYHPKTGTLDDLSFGATARFGIKNGGLRFVEEPKEPAKLVSIREDGDILTARWKFDDNEVEYRFRMKGKSLIVDVQCRGGNVKEFSSGGWSDLKNARLVQVPYLTGNGALRPAVIVAGASDADNAKTPFFILSQLDHTRSNASEFFWENKTVKDGKDSYVSAAACCRYNPKTDGVRNDCFERLFITVSPTFEEVLPNIPNDPSPWKSVTGERVWRAHGASNHDNDYKYWNRVHRYGVRKMLITDHETLWRDGGESFTFRTAAAPGRGGDEAQKEYTEKIHALGYVYGPYNNYTDYAPVNEYWNEDWVTRRPDGNFHSAWARCYNPKPAVAVQVEPDITEIIQEKFRFNTAYCDVHTAVTPWNYVDYDARVPGAGTLAATFFAYGEIMLHQKKVWGGPVYSEGNNHWYYSGLTDGNYAQDQAYFVYQADLPWLVDFDLLKIHPLENNFGMGYMNMFYGKSFGRMREKDRAPLDRFLAATLAFGHTGFLAMETGLAGGIRSYFAVQQLAARYADQTVKTIRYADETGTFLTTSEALASDSVKLNRLRIEYEDGFTLYVNGNDHSSWEVVDGEKTIAALPPNGWYVVDPKGEIAAWNLIRDGKRSVYVDSPSYLFAEVWDNPKGTPCRFDRLLCDRQLILLKNVDGNGAYEMIVGESNYAARSTMHGVRLDDEADADVVALDFNRNELGMTPARYARGMVQVVGIKGAFSYLLKPKPKPDVIASSKRLRVVPGETVPVENFGEKESITIPRHVTPGRWMAFQADESYLDFDVVPLCSPSASFDPDAWKLSFAFRSNLAESERVDWTLSREEQSDTREDVPFEPEKEESISFQLDPATTTGILPLKLRLDAPNEMSFEKHYWIKTDIGLAEMPPFPEKFELGQCLRNKPPAPLDGASGAYARLETVACGNTTRRAWSIHPPYKGDVGYVFLLSEPFVVPDEPEIVFSSEVGIRNGGDVSDGVLYRILVVEEGAEEQPVGEIIHAERNWKPLLCDLTPWRSKTIRLRLIADVGPANNSSADWACWSEFKLLSRRLKRMTTLHTTPVELTYLPATEPIQNPDDFTKAEKVELVYEGCGMDASDRYHSTATLNGIPLGRLPGAPGDEAKGLWSKASLVLPAEAVQSLHHVNRLEIISEDYFKIRRFRITATFADGAKRNTMLTNRTLSHPGSWKYAEGEKVSYQEPIQVDIATTLPE